jgi:hypothetical protein
MCVLIAIYLIRFSFNFLFHLHLVQGQDLYKSKQVRDKQIARILGKVCLIQFPFFFWTWTRCGP